MKICIIYYSGTGINAYIASLIAAQFRERGHQTTVIPWTGLDPEELGRWDLLGVGGPSVSFYAPRTFLRFLRKLPKRNTPFFLFSGYHGIQGHAFYSMYRVLKKRGYRYTGNRLDVYGIMSIRSWRRRYGRGLPASTLYGLDKIPGFTDDVIAACSPSSLAGPPGREKGNLLWDLFALLFSWPWQMALVDGYFKRADKESCTGCGLCWRVICPSGAIVEGTGRLPRFLWWKCEGCSGCVNICPEQAISTLLCRNHQPCNDYARFRLKQP